MTNHALPIQQSDRATILDVLRGFAILGIFIANSGGFSLYMFMEESSKNALFTASADHYTDYFLTAFIDGKFYSLFSLLFGIGFTIILDRNESSGKNPLPYFYRRVFLLALFGLAHIYLLWEGDILLLYAIIGMVLPLFRKLKDKTLIIISIALIFTPLLIDFGKVITDGKLNLAAPLTALALEADAKTGITEENFRTYLIDNTTYESVLNWCRGGIFWRYEYIVSSNRIPKVLAMFLLGLVVGRSMIYKNLESQKVLLMKLMKRGFVIGIPASLALAYFSKDEIYLPKAKGLWDTLFYAISVIPLSIAYTSSICILYMNVKWKKILSPMAAVGRMALTNYIMQTVFGIFIYYGLGLGMATKFGPALFVPIALIVYFIQIVYSNLWFQYFKYGPLEWVWRQLTYGKMLSIKK